MQMPAQRTLQLGLCRTSCWRYAHGNAAPMSTLCPCKRCAHVNAMRMSCCAGRRGGTSTAWCRCRTAAARRRSRSPRSWGCPTGRALSRTATPAAPSLTDHSGAALVMACSRGLCWRHPHHAPTRCAPESFDNPATRPPKSLPPPKSLAPCTFAASLLPPAGESFLHEIRR